MKEISTLPNTDLDTRKIRQAHILADGGFISLLMGSLILVKLHLIRWRFGDVQKQMEPLIHHDYYIALG